MGKEVCEISRFFVAPPREFAPAVWEARNHKLTHKYSQFSMVGQFGKWCIKILPWFLLGGALGLGLIDVAAD